MRPWKLASETATLDNLSGGRVILSVGLGAIDTGFEAFGEVTDRKTRAPFKRQLNRALIYGQSGGEFTPILRIALNLQRSAMSFY